MKLLINGERIVSLGASYMNKFLEPHVTEPAFSQSDTNYVVEANAVMTEEEVLTQWAEDNLTETDTFEIVSDDYSIPATLDELKAQYLENVKIEHSKQLNDLTGQATIEERDTWKIQQEAAENYLVNTNAADQEFLEGLLTPNEKAAIIAAGGSLAGTMANKILSKVHKTKKLIQFAGGMKRTAEEAINAATNVEDLEATITALKVQEQTTLADFIAGIEGRE